MAIHKMLVSYLILIFSATPVWAQPAAPPTEIDARAQEVIRLIDEDLSLHRELILDRVAQLSPEHRLGIYTETQKDPAPGLLLNFLLGFGLGSFITGDVQGGVTILVGELAGMALSLVGLAVSLPALIASLGPPSGTGLSAGALSVSLISFGLGLIALLVFRMGSLIRPFIYTEQYNRELKKLLGLTPQARGMQSYTTHKSDLSARVYAEYGLVAQFNF